MQEWEKDDTFGMYGVSRTFESSKWSCPTGKWINEYEVQTRSTSSNKFVSCHVEMLFGAAEQVRLCWEGMQNNQKRTLKER